MKKTVLFCIIIYIAHGQLFAQDNSFLVKYFHQISPPFATEQLFLSTKELPYEVSLKYFFGGNSANAHYYEEVENDEDHSVVWSGYKKKLLLPRNYFYMQEKLLLIYELYSTSSQENDPETFLGIFNDDGKQMDSLIIKYATIYSSPELYNFVRTKIHEDKIAVFDYRIADNEKEDFKTVILINHYIVDIQNSKFVKIKTEEIKSRYQLYEFDEGTENVKEEDPYYK